MKKISLPLVIVILFLLVGGITVLRANKGLTVTPPASSSVNSLDVTPGFPGTAEPTASQNEIFLSITSPANNSTVTTPTVTVTGKTVAKADVGINDKDIVADASGSFSTSVALDEGDNTIVVVASDADGNFAEKELTVTYYAPTQ